ncbi:synaptotagmin-14-like [Anneissia japonica]|uniref:synaptotagmin-14-like n=1 Tax=Anneissia japonica TaxID=1529436 RepID=UPI00142560FA|nr:synaptotagmin-14-like [Anneissia japonica]
MPLDDIFSTVGGKISSIGDSVTSTVSSIGDSVESSFTSFFGLEKREPSKPEENVENNNNVQLDEEDTLVEIKNDPNNEGEFLIEEEQVISGETSETAQPEDLDFRKGSLADLHYEAQDLPDDGVRRSRSPSYREYEHSRRSSSVKSAGTEEFFPTNVKGEQGYEPPVRSEDLGDVEQGTVGSGSFGSSGGLFDQDDENDTIAMGGEAGEEKPREPPPTVGNLEVAFSYSGEARRMNITVVKVSDIPAKDRGGPGSCRVRLALMPSKRQRAKTRIREGENPEFKELFRFTRLFPHELASTSMRFRLFGTEKMRKEQLIGECVTKFSSLNTNTTTTQTITIPILARSDTVSSGTSSPYSSSSDLSHSESNSSLQSMQHGGMPELLVGLSYNSTTGRLSVEILKGSHFKNLAAGRAPDSYVRVSLMSSSGFEMTKSKTSIRRGQPNPTFKETFIFQVAQFQLPDVTLLYTVFNKRAMKRKETLGWFSMGLQNSSEEELAHWNEMRDSKGHQVCRWHALLEP